MSTKNLSEYNSSNLPDAGSMRIGIVVSEWNHEITDNLLKGCLDTLKACGIKDEFLHIVKVPGSFELAIGAQMLLENRRCESVICLGCVIKGETPHFDFVCHSTAQAIQNVASKFSKPVIFGLLTDNTMEQSLARSGGAMGNKGVEAAVTAIKMVDVKRKLEKQD